MRVERVEGVEEVERNYQKVLRKSHTFSGIIGDKGRRKLSGNSRIVLHPLNPGIRSRVIYWEIDRSIKSGRVGTTGSQYLRGTRHGSAGKRLKLYLVKGLFFAMFDVIGCMREEIDESVIPKTRKMTEIRCFRRISEEEGFMSTY